MAMKSRITGLTSMSTNKLDNETKMYLKSKGVVDIPVARCYQAGAVFGSGLFVHGGQAGETLKTMSDWNLFDFGLGVWIKLEVDEVRADGQRVPLELTRKMHSMTTVFDPAIPSHKTLTRMLWASTLKEI